MARSARGLNSLSTATLRHESLSIVISLAPLLRRLAVDRKGVTALEYGIIAGVLGLVLITIFQHFGSTLTTLFNKIGSSI